MYFITTKRMLEVCFSTHPNIQYRTNLKTADFMDIPTFMSGNQLSFCMIGIAKISVSVYNGESTLFDDMQNHKRKANL